MAFADLKVMPDVGQQLGSAWVIYKDARKAITIEWRPAFREDTLCDPIQVPGVEISIWRFHCSQPLINLNEGGWYHDPEGGVTMPDEAFERLRVWGLYFHQRRPTSDASR